MGTFMRSRILSIVPNFKVKWVLVKLGSGRGHNAPQKTVCTITPQQQLIC